MPLFPDHDQAEEDHTKDDGSIGHIPDWPVRERPKVQVNEIDHVAPAGQAVDQIPQGTPQLETESDAQQVLARRKIEVVDQQGNGDDDCEDLEKVAPPLK